MPYRAPSPRSAAAAAPLRRTAAFLLCALACLAPALLPAPVFAQGTGSGSGVRVGLTVGGISTVGLVVEYVEEHRSLEFTVGTWSFRDLSASVVVKEYLGAGDLLPFLGGGLWLVVARPAGERTGVAAVLHAPVGVDWQAADGSYIGASLALNRAVAVRRTDPTDDLPLNGRLVPLPAAYYRWKR